MVPPQKTVTVAFLNVSSVVALEDLQNVVASLQIQASRDFGPIYGMNANLAVFTDQKAVPADAWQMIIGDDSDQIDALGYHELSSTGLPLGKVFAKTDKEDGMQWSVTASHELLEMLADPWACLCAQASDGRILAYEPCDAVEAEEFGYQINGVTVSDFVLPSWFDGSAAPYDYCKHVTSPGQLIKDGYISVLGPSGWSQVQAEHASVPDRGRVIIKAGSRRARRTMGRTNWRKSER